MPSSKAHRGGDSARSDGRWSNHDGVVLFMLQRTTADSAFSQYGYGTYQLDARTWSYDYSRIESLSGAIGGPAHVTTDRRDSRSFSVSRKGRKIILTFAGRDDDRREYDGPFFTYIQDGQVVRKWRRVRSAPACESPCVAPTLVKER